MSKKECKRVPSYAIRHLIQSLKEKGRTCRKGAEQRIDREILICDPEEEYVRRLAEALLLKKEVTAGVRICSSPEMVQELLKIGLIKVLLISEDVPYEKRKQIFTGKRIILTRQHCVDLGEEETELRKYQPVDGLMTGILKGLQEEKFPGSCADNGNGRILGVYSPVHRIGKTTFSLKLGKALAQSEDVLYLNLETYAGMGGYFRDQDAPDLANVLYYAKQERDDIGIRIASMVKRMGDLDYIPPMKVWTDLRAVHTEEWKTLFERLISQSVYSVIILDIGNGMEYTKERYGETEYVFVKKDDPTKPYQYGMIQAQVMRMIRQKDIRDDNGELLKFGTHIFRHCYGKKLTELHIEDWMIARLLGHKTLQSVHHYRRIGNKVMADETRKTREKMDLILMDIIKGWDGYEL